MSLTRQLGNKYSPIRLFMDIHFPRMRWLAQGFLRDARTRLRERAELDGGLILPEGNNGDYDWARTGTAFDYRARLYFQATPSEETVAYRGAVNLRWINSRRERMAFFSEPEPELPEGERTTGRMWWVNSIGERLAPVSEPELAEFFASIKEPEPEFAEFFASLDAWLAAHQTVRTRLSEAEENELNRYCVAMAMMDGLYRSGRWVEELNFSRHKLLDIADDVMLADMRNLSCRFFDEWDRKGMFDKPFVLGPIFDGSRNVGGADADLIVDRCLYDIKTTKHAKIPLGFLRQLIGYVLLDYSDEYELDSIGLYMSRQGLTCKWDLNDVLVALTEHGFKTLPDMRDELKIEFEEIFGEEEEKESND